MIWRTEGESQRGIGPVTEGVVRPARASARLNAESVKLWPGDLNGRL
jgi:hypothetical protein